MNAIDKVDIIQFMLYYFTHILIHSFAGLQIILFIRSKQDFPPYATVNFNNEQMNNNESCES